MCLQCWRHPPFMFTLWYLTLFMAYLVTLIDEEGDGGGGGGGVGGGVSGEEEQTEEE